MAIQKKERDAAESAREAIGKSLEGADMVFITLGAGGGTGSGAGPIVAEEAKNRDILTVGVATKPFTFEGAKRRENADIAIDNLSRNVDALITIPNDRLLQTIDPENTTFRRHLRLRMMCFGKVCKGFLS